MDGIKAIEIISLKAKYLCLPGQKNQGIERVRQNHHPRSLGPYRTNAPANAGGRKRIIALVICGRLGQGLFGRV